ncbi:MAG: energy transducer TonB [Bacteroidia bacterium]|nr:energy transducer TonB [Bacteroidia bacterium]
MALFDKERLDEIVFEKRNKKYGAFILRRIYRKHVITSLIVSIILILAIIIPPFIMASLNKNKEVIVTHFWEANLSDITLPDDEIEAIQPPLPQPPPPSLEQQVKFIAPIIVDTVKDDIKIASIDDLVANNNNNPPVNIPDENVGDKKSDVIDDISDKDKIYIVTEEPPTFPGGDEALIKYVQEHLEIPEIVQILRISGIMYVQFVIYENGEVRDVEVVRSLDATLDKEAVRVIESLPPWTPGKQGGRPVKVKQTIPINILFN